MILDRAIERLHTRGNSPNFHYQRKVPTQLREIIGKSHWREALKTSDRALAINKRNALNIVTDAEIEAATAALETMLREETRIENAEASLTTANPALVDAVRKAGGVERYEESIKRLVQARSIHAVGMEIASAHGPDPARPDLAYDDPSMRVERASDTAVAQMLNEQVAEGAADLKSIGLDTTDELNHYRLMPVGSRLECNSRY